MFNVLSPTGLPGFRVRPQDDVPGFDVDENGSPPREGTWSDGMGPVLGTPQGVIPANCTTVNGTMDCTSLGGLTFGGLKAPPGFPQRLDTNTDNYHGYSVPDGPYPDSPRTMREDVINYPTPGPRKLVRPATPEGTLNEATPEWLYELLTTPLPIPGVGWQPLYRQGTLINPVRSYLRTDQNGKQIVVNVTEPGHKLHPGYVVRNVTPSDGGATIQNEGEGSAELQGPLAQFFGLADDINSVWRGLYQGNLDRSQ